MENDTPKENQTPPKKRDRRSLPGLRQRNMALYELFRIWLSIPHIFRHPPQRLETGEKWEVEDFIRSQGIHDEKVIEMAKLRTANDFARKYEVTAKTLSTWKYEIFEKHGAFTEAQRNIVNGLIPNVIHAIYANAMKGNALSQRLFMQMAGFEEKQKIKHELTPIESITFIESNEPLAKGATFYEADADNAPVGE